MAYKNIYLVIIKIKALCFCLVALSEARPYAIPNFVATRTIAGKLEVGKHYLLLIYMFLLNYLLLIYIETGLFLYL